MGTLSTPDLRYSYGIEGSNVAFENNNLKILTGNGIGEYPLGDEYQFGNRTWNGVIHYDGPDFPSAAPTLMPSLSPSIHHSEVPSFAPTASNMVRHTIVTEGDGTQDCYGNMFDVETLTPLSIIGIDILANTHDEVEFEILTKE